MSILDESTHQVRVVSFSFSGWSCSGARKEYSGKGGLVSNGIMVAARLNGVHNYTMLLDSGSELSTGPEFLRAFSFSLEYSALGEQTHLDPLRT